MTLPAVIRLVDLTLCYRRHPAVHHVNGLFQEGSCTAIFGPNGAGKSTLLKGIMGLLPATQGRVERRLPLAEIGYLAQHAEREEYFPLTVMEVVAMGLWRHIGWSGAITPALWQVTHQALTAVGLTGFEKRHLASLSRGQFQRMLFARLLAQNPRLILLDEPFSAMDHRTTQDMLSLMAKWQQEGRTVITVLHDPAQVHRHFPQCLLLGRQVIAWGETSQVLTPENLTRAQNMCEAWEEDAETCRLSLPGSSS